MSSPFFQTLEVRTFLSATPAVLPNDPTLQADQQQLLSDTQKLQSDRQTFQNALTGDRAKVAADRKAMDDAKKSARGQLELDQKSMNDAMAADRAAGQPTRDVWYPVMLSDMAAIKADAGNAEKLAADKLKFDSDAALFRTAMAPYETQTKADIAIWNGVIATDKANVETAGKSLTDQLNADLLTLKNDEQGSKATLKADELAVKADAQKLERDFAQYKKSHKTEAAKKENKLGDLPKTNDLKIETLKLEKKK